MQTIDVLFKKNGEKKAAMNVLGWAAGRDSWAPGWKHSSDLERARALTRHGLLRVEYGPRGGVRYRATALGRSALAAEGRDAVAEILANATKE